MADDITEVTSESWFGRLASAFKGVLVGLVMIVGAAALLFWNEGRAVHTAQGLAEGAASVVDVDAQKLDPANEHKLVHVSGKITTTEVLSDPDFGVTATALRLMRTVETYQWEQQKESHSHDKLGGGRETVTTYKYSRDWFEKLIDSRDFHESSGHENPRSVPYESASFTAAKATLGAFTPTASQLSRLKNFQKIPVDDAMLKTLPPRLQSQAKPSGAFLFLGPDAAQPRVGDQRVSFKSVPPQVASIIASQLGGSFEPYATKSGTTLDLLEPGDVSAAAMFKTAQDENTMLTWILRLVGFILEWIGISLLFGPFVAFADVIPLLGDILGAGIGFFSFVIGLIISLLVIAIAWIAYRPLLGIALLAAVVGLLVMAKQRSAGSRPPAAAAR